MAPGNFQQIRLFSGQGYFNELLFSPKRSSFLFWGSRHIWCGIRLNYPFLATPFSNNVLSSVFKKPDCTTLCIAITHFENERHIHCNNFMKAPSQKDPSLSLSFFQEVYIHIKIVMTKTLHQKIKLSYNLIWDRTKMLKSKIRRPFKSQI